MATGQSVIYIRRGSRGGNRQRERIIQRSLTHWLRAEYPEADFYNDWSSGAFLTKGQNAQRMALVSNNGWVDLFIAEPRRGYYGLFLELKREDVKVYLKDGLTLRSDPQIKIEAAFLQRQNKKGYCARFACGLEKAKEIIDWYFETDRPEQAELEIF